MLGFPPSAVQRCLEAGVNAECCLCCVLHGRCVCVCVCVTLLFGWTLSPRRLWEGKPEASSLSPCASDGPFLCPHTCMVISQGMTIRKPFSFRMLIIDRFQGSCLNSKVILIPAPLLVTFFFFPPWDLTFFFF